MHSRVHRPAPLVDGSRLGRRIRRAFLSGKSDDARQGVPAHARLYMCASRLAEHLYADMCLCSQFAGDAPSIATAATAVIAAAVATVAVCPRRFPRRGIAALIWGRGGIYVTPVSTVGTG